MHGRMILKKIYGRKQSCYPVRYYLTCVEEGRTEHEKRSRTACASVRVSNWACLAQNSMSMLSEHRMWR